MSGCTFDAGPLKAVQCGSDDDCGLGKVCEEGFCRSDFDAPLQCASDSECGDGQFCNGVEVCDPQRDGADEKGCAPGETVDVDDGIECTQDICDETNDVVSNFPGADCDCPGGRDIECEAVLAAELDVDIEAVGDLCVTSTCNEALECVRGNRETGAACDDGVSCTSGDTCDGQGLCQGSAQDDLCEDGTFCNGRETCQPGAEGADLQGCVEGELVVDDGQVCTADSCDEDSGVVINAAIDGCCQVDADCVSEGAGVCQRYFCQQNVCGSEPLARGEACDDGLACTNTDVCDGEGTCAGAADSQLCDDDAFCNGSEICDPDSELRDENGCISGLAPAVDDGVECSIDSCDEDLDRVVNDLAACPCQEDSECLPLNPNPCLTYSCSDAQQCETSVRADDSPCEDGLACTTGDVCQAGSCTGVPTDGECEDGLFCNGSEICQPGHPEADGDGCRARDVPVIDDGISCTNDRCDEDNDRVENNPDDGPCDNDLFCDGLEVCDPADVGADADGCVAGAPLDLSDGVDCTDDSCDEANDQIVNTINDGNCDDAAFCNGAETCDPGAQGADANGCVSGVEPQVDDGIPCTDDSCDEVNDTLNNIPNDTSCDDGAFCNGVELCEPTNIVADANGCALGLPVDPNDDIPCTNDECDEETDSFVNNPQDNRCDDGAFCNGAETCAPGDPEAVLGCLDGAAAVDTHPDQRPCLLLTCDEENDIVEEDATNCTEQCQDDSDCQGQVTEPCQVGVCDPQDLNAADDGCTFPAAPDDSLCDLNCDTGSSSGRCQAGACDVPPEGSTGDTFCADGQDNDCDGEADGDDSDCLVPDLLEVSAPANGPAGLNGDGVVLEVTPRLGGAPVTNQDANLYCTSNIIDTELPLDDPVNELSARSDVQVLDEAGQDDPSAAGLTSLAFGGDESLRGIEVCDGYSLVLGPYGLPGLGQPVYSLMVEVTMGFEAGEMSLGDNLVFSYRTGGTTNKYVPLVASTGVDAAGLQTYRFMLFNGGGFNNVRLRFDTIGALGVPDACGFVESVRLYRAPRIENTDRTYPQWTFDNVTEDAVQFFRTDIANDFFTELSFNDQGTHTLETVAEADNDQNGLGAAWAFRDGIAGALILPPVESFDVDVDRANPLIFDFRATTFGNTYGLSELAHAGFFVGEELTTLKKVASIMPTGPDAPDHLISHYELGNLTSQNRFMVVMPEEAKPLFGRSVGFASGPLLIDDTKRVYLDGISLYYHTRPTQVDLDVEVLGPIASDSPTHQIRLRHADAGQAAVQCYWQIPGDAQTATISSEPIRITFE